MGGDNRLSGEPAVHMDGLSPVKHPEVSSMVTCRGASRFSSRKMQQFSSDCVYVIFQ